MQNEHAVPPAHERLSEHGRLVHDDREQLEGLLDGLLAEIRPPVAVAA